MQPRICPPRPAPPRHAAPSRATTRHIAPHVGGLRGVEAKVWSAGHGSTPPTSGERIVCWTPTSPYITISIVIIIISIVITISIITIVTYLLPVSCIIHVTVINIIRPHARRGRLGSRRGSQAARALPADLRQRAPADSHLCRRHVPKDCHLSGEMSLDISAALSDGCSPFFQWKNSGVQYLALTTGTGISATMHAQVAVTLPILRAKQRDMVKGESDH